MKIQRSFWPLLTVFILFVPNIASAQPHTGTNGQKTTSSHSKHTPALTFAWETDSLLTTVESVLYDPATGYIYSANIDGHFMDKDGQGSISKIDLQGNIVERDWIAGLNAPTGLCVYNGRLYTTDIDRIIEIDMAAGAIAATYNIEGAQALNDITVSPNGTVYASDTGGNQVFRLKEGVATALLSNIDTPNGLVYHGGQILVSQWTPETLGTIDLKTNIVNEIATGLPQADGVEVFEDDGYLVSSWGGRVYFVDPSGETSKILDTSAAGKNAADVSLVAGHNLVLVATFSQNTVAAYKVE
jgi:sugar lactone lactonase YvrE